MKLIYNAPKSIDPFRIWQYSEFFEIFIFEDVRKKKKYFFDCSRLLEIFAFKKQTKIEIERIAFNDGSRKFFFYIYGCLIATAKTGSILPKCKISEDRTKLIVESKEINLF